MLIDTHAHLNDFEAFPDYIEIIKALDENNISKVITVGSSRKSSEDAVRLAGLDSKLFAAVGTHPSEIDNITESDYEYYLAAAKNNMRVVAIGEAGLDYHYEGFDKVKQREVFIRHIEIAHMSKLPLIIHLRDSFEDTLKILKENKRLLEYGGLLHCYSGSTEFLKEIFILGLDIALGGTVTFKNARNPIEVAKAVPIDRLHIETDCPYLTPHPYRGTRNEPKYVKLVAEKIAGIREMDINVLIAALDKNAHRLFKRLEV